MSRARSSPGEWSGLLFRMRPAPRFRPRLLRALRLDAGGRSPLLQSLRSPRRRLTLAFSSPVSYQSASLNSGARREPMGLTVVGRPAAGGVDGFDSRCAAAHAPARDRGAVRSTLRRAHRLQLRRRRPAHRRSVVLADDAIARSLSVLRLLLPERRLAVGLELRSEVPAADPLRSVVRRRRIELVAHKFRRG